ncbi:hypothetical protein EVAR_50207_1 [Eumeta japonica]|uniref:Uncharacterized protein n=1 Tax=Eumeta variegata TaxID=151549 RepID=A0A4C1WWR5_EUMVA|nr:hypothetical protein EVAR_50207_1 [Eumeta japonica]
MKIEGSHANIQSSRCRENYSNQRTANAASGTGTDVPKAGARAGGGDFMHNNDGFGEARRPARGKAAPARRVPSHLFLNVALYPSNVMSFRRENLHTYSEIHVNNNTVDGRPSRRNSSLRSTQPRLTSENQL